MVAYDDQIALHQPYERLRKALCAITSKSADWAVSIDRCSLESLVPSCVSAESGRRGPVHKTATAAKVTGNSITIAGGVASKSGQNNRKGGKDTDPAACSLLSVREVGRKMTNADEMLQVVLDQVATGQMSSGLFRTVASVADLTAGLSGRRYIKRWSPAKPRRPIRRSWRAPTTTSSSVLARPARSLPGVAKDGRQDPAR